MNPIRPEAHWGPTSPMGLGLLGTLLTIATVYLILGYEAQASRFAMVAAVTLVISVLGYIASRHAGMRGQAAHRGQEASLAQRRRLYTTCSVIVAALGIIGVVLGVRTGNHDLTVYSWGVLAFGFGFGSYALVYTSAQIRQSKSSQE